MSERAVRRLQVAGMALVAYLPLLFARPGRMVGDTKLYLYLDPGELISRAASSWDPSAYGGWVPHQLIAYLWPQGPWYWFFDLVGAPDWVAHRLWLGTLFVLAGLGVRHLARLLGLSATAAACAGLVYQLSPYVLPYASRTSSMLMPWAALGWIVALTIRAARSHSPWRASAALALVVASCSAVNATAILMIIPAPVLWLIDAGIRRRVSWRRVMGVGARVAALSVPACAWWIAMVRTQSRFGADVLRFSESVEATSFTTSSPEVLRGMGYWLFYIRDPYSFATSAAARFMGSGTALAISFALLVVCITGLAVVRWEHRRFVVLLVVVGVIIAVGPHPIDDPSPLMSPVANNSRGALPLALRSSARAVPVIVLGLALGAAMLINALAVRARRARRGSRAAAAWLVAALAMLNLPVLFDGTIIDASLSRQNDVPAAWLDGAALVESTAAGRRVLQLPGAEFGAFRWGYTAEPPLVGLTDVDVLSRDLLPLGSAGLEDLFLALDDRAQSGVLEPAAIAPVARLLGVGTVWVPNDLAFDRYRNPWPSESAAIIERAPGLRPLASFGDPVLNVPDVAMLDERVLGTWGPTGVTPPNVVALSPVSLFAVDGAATTARAGRDVIVVVGSGDGLVDAAAAGLIDGLTTIVYAADLDGTQLGGHEIEPKLVIVTDSHRDRAHHWRSSQDVVGATEAGGPATELWADDEADARLPLFGIETDSSSDQQTVALLGGVTVSASGYGEGFAYRPERRPSMALDGDPRTAWTVGERGDPVGHSITVEGTIGGELRLLQRQDAAANRVITAITVTTSGSSRRIELDERSLEGEGQRIPIDGTRVTVTIDATAARADGADSGPSGVGFAELGVGPFPEVIRLPALPDVLRQDTPLAVVMTRLRVDERSRWRSDPEPVLRRAFTVDVDRTMSTSITLRLADDAPDGVLDTILGGRASVASSRLAGDPLAGGRAATDADRSTAWTTPFEQVVGAALTVRLAAPLSSFTLEQPNDSLHSLITAVRVTWDGGSETVAVPQPNAAGLSVVDLPRVIEASSFDLSIAEIDERVTIDRRYGEPTILPAAIREVTSPAIDSSAVSPTAPTGCRDDLVELDGTALPIELPSDAWSRLARREELVVGLCGGTPLALDGGPHILTTADGRDTGIDIDRVTLTSGVPPTADAPVTVRVSGSSTHRVLSVPACPQGCWVTPGEGFNPAWRATAGGTDLGAPVQINGGASGWWLPPSDVARTVDLTWPPQREITIALWISALTVVACAALLVVRRRPSPHEAEPTWVDDEPEAVWPWDERTTTARALVAATSLVALSALVASPTTAVVALPVAVALAVTRRLRVAALFAPAILTLIGAYYVVRQVTERIVPNQLWVTAWERTHRPGLLAVLILTVAALAEHDRPPSSQRGTAPRPPSG